MPRRAGRASAQEKYFPPFRRSAAVLFCGRAVLRQRSREYSSPSRLSAVASLRYAVRTELPHSQPPLGHEHSAAADPDGTDAAFGFVDFDLES